MKSLLGSFAVALLRLVPARLGRHLMFLLQSSRDIPDRWGVHIRSIHYYEPLPDFQAITPEQTCIRRVSPAIDFDLPGQLALQRTLAAACGEELRQLAVKPEVEGGFPFANEYFSHLDAAIYYALIRHLKPARVVEIGCGFSTRIADKALKANRAEGHPAKLICIEPYPQPRLSEFDLDMELIEKKVEDIPLDFFREMGANDILFIDSSHVAKFQSDVCREFLDILPIIKPGVWVHVHDIFFPRDYPEQWLRELRWAFNEQYLLEAFLMFNAAFTSKCSLHWLWLEYADIMSSFWPADVMAKQGGNGAASFWMKRTMQNGSGW